MSDNEALPYYPSPALIKAMRLERGHTQAQAAASVMSTDRAWRMWEAGDRRMHPALWYLYQRGGITHPATTAAL